MQEAIVIMVGMSFYRAFITVTYLTVISGILSLALAEGSPFYIIVGTFGSLAIWYFVDTRSRLHISRGVGTLLSVLAFIYLLLDIFYFSGFFVLSFTHFLIIIQLIKLCLEKENRDYVQIYLISFMHLIVTSVLTTNIVFAILFVIYILVATWALLLFHLKTEGTDWRSIPVLFKNKTAHKMTGMKVPALLWNRELPDRLGEKNFINRYFFFSTTTITIVILILTVVIFLMLPRYTAGLFVSKLGRMAKLSGFSSKVNLNSIGSLKLDYSPVMRMELLNYQGGYGKEFYIRGIAFDTYSRGWWWSSCKRDANFYANSMGDIYPTFGGDMSWMKTINQRFTVEGLDTTVLFHIYPLKIIRSKFKWVKLDASDTINTPYPYYRGAKYEITSGLLPEYDTPPNVFKRFPRFTASCFLNSSGIKDDIRNLSLKIVRDPQSDKSTENRGDNQKSGEDIGEVNPFLQARMIEDYLKKNYSYTLENPSGGKLDPISDFLFESKAGHCEYFATAMVLLLRSINIPARFVNGFKAEEWNDIGQYYLIRQKDAHSWVEAYFYPLGWYPFDPTPAMMEEPTGFYKFTVNTKLGKYFDYLQMKWRAWVIDYSFDAQKKAFKRLRDKTRNMRYEVFKAITSWRLKAKDLALAKYITLRDVFWFIAGAIFFSVLGHISYQYIKKTRFFRELLKRHIRISVKFYAELIRILERRGIKRHPTLTPFEFLNQSIDKSSQDYDGILTITELFYKVRYGDKKLTSMEVDIVSDIIYKLRYEKG
ncbi:DUF3488 domain-containing protein [bacterium]|nr:DUF3488 domain-containing protein [bacterium]